MWVKGTVTWLAWQADSFPGGEESFSIKVKSAPQEAVTSNVIENNSLWSNFWLCLLTGLLAVLTPCVFPLIPVTVSFF